MVKQVKMHRSDGDRFKRRTQMYFCIYFLICSVPELEGGCIYQILPSAVAMAT